jgi:hypothetical protein
LQLLLDTLVPSKEVELGIIEGHLFDPIAVATRAAERGRAFFDTPPMISRPINQLDRSQGGLVFPPVTLFFTLCVDDHNLPVLEGLILVGVGEMMSIHWKISST